MSKKTYLSSWCAKVMCAKQGCEGTYWSIEIWVQRVCENGMKFLANVSPSPAPFLSDKKSWLHPSVSYVLLYRHLFIVKFTVMFFPEATQIALWRIASVCVRLCVCASPCADGSVFQMSRWKPYYRAPALSLSLSLTLILLIPTEPQTWDLQSSKCLPSL